jgi:hypothetical protein
MQNSSKKQFLLWLKDSVVQPSMNRASRMTAHRYGAALSQHYVGGFPKSGTTWITRMVAGYMALPWIGATYFAFGMPGVVHHHWDYDPSLARSIYVVRDGRDVMVSTYFNVTKAYMLRKHALSELSPISPARIAGFTVGRFAVLSRRLEHLFGRNFDPADVRRNLPRFIEAEMQKPFIVEARSPWPQHVRKWLDSSDSFTCVKYEEMLADTRGTMAELLRDYLESEPVETDLDYVVRRYSFKRLTGRERGEESRSSDARKGISGDWRNHFTPESRSIFTHYAGDLLIELGYEPDDQWQITEPPVESTGVVEQ